MQFLEGLLQQLIKGHGTTLVAFEVNIAACPHLKEMYKITDVPTIHFYIDSVLKDSIAGKDVTFEAIDGRVSGLQD